MPLLKSANQSIEDKIVQKQHTQKMNDLHVLTSLRENSSCLLINKQVVPKNGPHLVKPNCLS